MQKEKKILEHRKTGLCGFLMKYLMILVVMNVCIGNVGLGESKKTVHITDELDDVVDSEEDEEWKQWGRSKPWPTDFDPPPDPTTMDPFQFQAHMLSRLTGPSFGFVKLCLGVHRTAEAVTQISMQWTKRLKTGAVEVKFMAVDTSTIMFTLEKGQDIEELKEFILNQPDAYEVKIGDLAFRRPRDPPLEQVVEMLQKKRSENESDEESEQSKDEL